MFGKLIKKDDNMVETIFLIFLIYCLLFGKIEWREEENKKNTKVYQMKNGEWIELEHYKGLLYHKLD